MSVCSERERAMVPVVARWVAMGMAVALGWSGWHGSARAANEGAGSGPSEARICPSGDGASVIVTCFGDGGAAVEQEAVRPEVEREFEALTREGLRPEGGEQLLVRVDGAEPNLVFGVQPIGGDGVPLAGGEKRLTQCGGERGCTSEEWREVVRTGMRDALVELQEDRERVTSEPVERPRVDPGRSTEPQRYRPRGLGIAGIVTASVGGLGLLTGAGLMVVGGLPENPAPGVRQDRDFLPLSRDFYTPGAVTLGASAAVIATGIAMVIVDLRRWKARERATTTARRRGLRLAASPWGRGVRIEGQF